MSMIHYSRNINQIWRSLYKYTRIVSGKKKTWLQLIKNISGYKGIRFNCSRRKQPILVSTWFRWVKSVLFFLTCDFVSKDNIYVFEKTSKIV